MLYYYSSEIFIMHIKYRCYYFIYIQLRPRMVVSSSVSFSPGSGTYKKIAPSFF
jgi:hypothetical protein